MALSGGTRSTAATAALIGLAGLAVSLHGAYRNQPAHALAGICITMIALTGLILVALRKWTTDTSIERASLAAAQREAQAERARYLALQCGLENEQGRLNRDMAAERRRIAGQLIRERAAMRAEFEEKRATLISETMEATFLMIRSGKFAPDATPSGQLIHFPRQEQTAAPQRARSREHGHVGP